MATFTSNSPEETEAAGRCFSETLMKGDVVALEGDLGAGKTCFARGLVAGIGSPAAVSSPTFTLLHEYPGGRLPVFHFDFFRLTTEGEAAALCLEDDVFPEGISVIEWASRFPNLLPAASKWVRIGSVSDHRRSIELP